MKNILNSIWLHTVCMMFTGGALAASRDANVAKSRASVPATRNAPASNPVRNVNIRGTATRTAPVTVSARTTAPVITSRASVNSNTITRVASGIAATARTNRGVRAVVSPRAMVSSRDNVGASGVVARAATDNASTSSATTMADTRIGAEYDKCKTAYFTCMDQFCKLKNDDYRRCSCSDRVYELDSVRDTLADAGQQLTVFNENLEVVGLTTEQATAMRTPSEGEDALTDDESASKALLQAIMNSIRGEDSNVSGKYSDLNSINISFDTANAFGMQDAGQVIATYNGQNLYSAVYPQCRSAVKADCNDASLQRAITAYLMAVEQDCNTVQTAMDNQRKKVKSAIRESGAMLDLARVENRKNHNSSDITTCINEVEAAILSEQVCGAGYHKCLDNGEFIDVTTGKPIAGVVHFYELKELLVFDNTTDAASQKLAKNSANRTFVSNFERRVKQFAEPALDKCVEDAEFVWSEYLDKAMLDIYYAQNAKVEEITRGCFDFVSACYMNGDKALTAAMAELAADSNVLLQPDKLQLTSQMCTDYIASCDNMFDGNIVDAYIKNQKDTDTLASCRAVAHQCFKDFGGTNYENFYYPYSGSFEIGHALDWFTLYEYVKDGNDIVTRLGPDKPVSRCAQQLYAIDSCRDIIYDVFGGFDVITAAKSGTNFVLDNDGAYNRRDHPQKYGTAKFFDNNNSGVEISQNKETLGCDNCTLTLAWREPRPVGVATEVYYQIMDILETQCENLQGKFVDRRNMNEILYSQTDYCVSNFYGSAAYIYGLLDDETGSSAKPARTSLVGLYGIANGEYMCPSNYSLNVDTLSWGACLCWENGARRSKNGLSAKCMAILPTHDLSRDGACPVTGVREGAYAPATTDENATAKWCTSKNITDNGIVCLPTHSFVMDGTESVGCKKGEKNIIGLPLGNK